MEHINYEIGDLIASKESPLNIIGRCTGLTHGNTCVEIDGKCYGGKHFFTGTKEIDYEEIKP